MSQGGKKSTELIPGLQAEDLLGMAAVCMMGYLFIKHPQVARQALQLVDQLLTPAPRQRVELATVQRRLEELRKP